MSEDRRAGPDEPATDEDTPVVDPGSVRLRARIFNERIKMFASALNALAIAFIGAAFVFPIIRDDDLSALLTLKTWVWILAGLGLHGCVHAALGRLRRED